MLCGRQMKASLEDQHLRGGNNENENQKKKLSKRRLIAINKKNGKKSKF